MNSEFVAALEQLNSELGIPLEELIRTVEQALADAYRRAFDPPGYVTVHIDPATAAMQVTSRTYGPDGEEVLNPLPTEDFARMAAQTAKQAVTRHIRSLEREKAVTEAAEHRGELATGVIDRVENGTVHLDMGGRAEGVMPPEEQIPGEEMRPGKPLTVVILDTRRGARDPQVQVSRASRLFVRRLLEAEVPEIKNGAVAIKAIAREPGLRSKVAVHSDDPSVDAVGACVGPKGVRHRSLLAELGREHIDFVPWSDDPATFAAAAVGPASVVDVVLDRSTNTALLHVPPGQLSLAIGKDGQNARLAAKLTGWRIDIKPASEQAGAEDPT
ncbi:MAG TPA: transcription termination factor NusA [Candidatus Dormibacteraeota bacterium]|nr:transcription termination factor NusA [Candidatus Dormibacteraeota bacterium]